MTTNEEVNMSALTGDVDELEQRLAEKRAARAKEQAMLASETVREAVEEDEADAELEEILSVLESQGLRREDVLKAKERFGKIYSFALTDDKVYIFRPLIKREWDGLLELTDRNSEEMEIEMICKATIFPRMTKARLQEEPAGLQPLLSQIIMTASGFIPLESALQIVRQV